ncbi:hypothetical protein SAMN04488107_4507 [Geodermatophilus saharensis]|uniref:Uncharacterized protein n=1 Tax=Geodermatophilus saharensis TaxID=1137994 RepID=A0A239IV51_9ACTN|nr:hypothetical protein [Geodermatophilus saharensis]SNS97477.1 hypothetical protein SAMN04488107_4507 [Geodermatophilus saharensis]
MSTSTGAAKAEPLNDLTWAESAQALGPRIGLADLLQSLQLLAKDADRDAAVQKKWRDDTPASMQVIRSGALGITKGATAWVAGAGGLGAVLSAVAAALAGFSAQAGEAVVATLIGAAALTFSGTAIACAIFIAGDLHARGQATAARHSGRAEVASAFLRATSTMPPGVEATAAAARGADLRQQVLFALAAFPDKVHFKTDGDQNWSLATGARRHERYDIQIRDAAGSWTAIGDVVDYTTNP